jgi:hypothetical protein
MRWRADHDVETTDWRAVCGRTARTVRRAGRVDTLPDPYHTPSWWSLISRLNTFFPFEKISTVHHAVPPALQGRLQGALKIGEKIRFSSASLNSGVKRKIQSPGGYRAETGCGLYPSQCSYHFPTAQCHFGAETQFDNPAIGNEPPQFGSEDTQPIVGYQINIFLPCPK